MARHNVVIYSLSALYQWKSGVFLHCMAYDKRIIAHIRIYALVPSYLLARDELQITWPSGINPDIGQYSYSLPTDPNDEDDNQAVACV